MSDSSSDCVVYFDGACPLCRREVAHYRAQDATASIAWEYERYYAAIAWNYTSGYREDQSGQNYETIDGNPPDVRSGRDYNTIDLRTRYTIPKVEANLSFGINNVFDERPPAIFSAFESNVDRQYADLRGRFYYLELSKKF